MQSELGTITEIVTQKMMFNSMPNEMLKAVLDKLEVMELIAIRAVCTRWLSVIEDICREKRSIVIVSNDDGVDLPSLSERFNSMVDFHQNCAVFRLKQIHYFALSENFCILLANLFPQVENLVIDVTFDRSPYTAENLFLLLSHWSSTIVNLFLPTSSIFPSTHHASLYDHIDKLTSLKRLDFPNVDSLKSSTLARLQHCFFIDKYKISNVIPRLGPSCTSLYTFNCVSLSDMTQLFKLNAPLVKSLTHLSLSTPEQKVLSFVCSNFAALQMLNIKFPVYPGRCIFNADMITHLTRLSNLSQLSIDGIKIDLPTMPQLNISSLNSIRVLSMSNFVFTNNRQFDNGQFCRVLSNIFPFLKQLTIESVDPLVREGISKHLDRFVHLHKHVIVPV